WTGGTFLPMKKETEAKGMILASGRKNSPEAWRARTERTCWPSSRVPRSARWMGLEGSSTRRHGRLSRTTQRGPPGAGFQSFGGTRASKVADVAAGIRAFFAGATMARVGGLPDGLTGSTCTRVTAGSGAGGGAAAEAVAEAVEEGSAEAVAASAVIAAV